MCNDYRLKLEIEAIRRDFEDIRVNIRFPEGIPNLEPKDDIRITDPAPIVRASPNDPGATELVNRRWSWPAPNGKPVYNFRSEGRDFGPATPKGGRCLILADGFYEFTANEDPRAKRKHKWLFTCVDHDLFCIAGIWRANADVGEAFTMLTTEPGPDVAPYHGRQVVLLGRADWGRWLDAAVPAAEVLRPALAGTLEVAQIS